MKKLTNLIGSFILTVTIIAFPIITGIGMDGDWLECIDGALIHPWLAVLWGLCLVCTIVEVIILTLVINESE